MRCFCASTRQVARRLTRHYEEYLRPAGLTPAQFELLANLQGQPGVSQSTLADRLGVDQTTLSRNLKVMAANGWIRSQSPKEDARRAAYELTDDGRLQFQRAAPCWQRAQAAIQEKLGAAEPEVWNSIDRLLATVR